MYDEFLVQNGGRRHLGFLKFENFNNKKGQEVQTASTCQIWVQAGIPTTAIPRATIPTTSTPTTAN